MTEELKKKTQETAELYFKGISGERPSDLWKSFDKELTREINLFYVGKLYAREKIPHHVRQLVTVAALTVLSRTEELRHHLHAALNVGCSTEELAEVIFQMATYGGMPVVHDALRTFRGVLQEKGLWPVK